MRSPKALSLTVVSVVVASLLFFAGYYVATTRHGSPVTERPETPKHESEEPPSASVKTVVSKNHAAPPAPADASDVGRKHTGAVQVLKIVPDGISGELVIRGYEARRQTLKITAMIRDASYGLDMSVKLEIPPGPEFDGVADIGVYNLKSLEHAVVKHYDLRTNAAGDCDILEYPELREYFEFGPATALRYRGKKITEVKYDWKEKSMRFIPEQGEPVIEKIEREITKDFDGEIDHKIVDDRGIEHRYDVSPAGRVREWGRAR